MRLMRIRVTGRGGVAMFALFVAACGGGPTSPTSTASWNTSGGIGLISVDGSLSNLLNIEVRIDDVVVGSSTSVTPRVSGVAVFNKGLSSGSHTLAFTITQERSPYTYYVYDSTGIISVKEGTLQTMIHSCFGPSSPPRLIPTGSPVTCSFTLP